MGNKCTTATESCGYQCTGYDGAHVWDKLHKAVSEIDCDTCRPHAEKNMVAFHDIVHAGLGVKVHDKGNLKRYVDEVNCVYDHCKARGDC